MSHHVFKAVNAFNLSNSSTKEFLSELSRQIGIPIVSLIQQVTDEKGIKSTWVHPDVSINLAQWLSPKFAVKVSQWISAWMSGKIKHLVYHS